jgi:hypothetical protein
MDGLGITASADATIEGGRVNASKCGTDLSFA